MITNIHYSTLSLMYSEHFLTQRTLSILETAQEELCDCAAVAGRRLVSWLAGSAF